MRSYPSLTTLLGLLAVAGYQNREKIAELLRSATANQSGAGGRAAAVDNATSPLDQLLAGAGRLIGNATTSGGLIASGLNELLKQFTQNGKGETAQSWVSDGPNRSISPQELRQALGLEVLGALILHTGLSEEEILARLSRDLPDAVDRYTPNGEVPITSAAA